VEVSKFGWKGPCEKLKKLGCEVKLRTKDESPFITDSGNYIIDCTFDRIDHPKGLESEINNIPGVIDNGLFLGLTDLVIMGTEDGGKLFSKSS
jgi:ribose 5-phosphate isomerase A